MFETTSYELSRIYASGWMAGKKYDHQDPEEIDSSNPYQLPDERARWDKGFRDAAFGTDRAADRSHK